jgi:ectoine hydroxylase-related dioxygenase (phytanoyl-CoA dioxygenase family)
VPDIDVDRDRYRLASWDMGLGDVLIFHPLVLHGSGGNTSLTVRRRALATLWTGDDLVYRDLLHRAPLPPNHGLVDGGPFTSAMFPRVVGDAPVTAEHAR